MNIHKLSKGTLTHVFRSNRRFQRQCDFYLSFGAQSALTVDGSNLIKISNETQHKQLKVPAQNSQSNLKSP
jgi:hypothetical protein